jgi:myo-inositol-1-phosphate synthase
MTSSTPKIAPADGRLGVLVVGLGAVSTPLIAGVELAKRGMGQPFGSMTQMGTIRLGKRTEGRSPLVKDFVPLARLEDIEAVAAPVLTHRLITTFAAQAEGVDAKQIVGRLVQETIAEQAG